MGKHAASFLKSANVIQSRSCSVCREPWRAAVHEILEVLAGGEQAVALPLAAIHRYLQAEVDPPYPHGVDMVRHHIREHEPELHAKWKGRG